MAHRGVAQQQTTHAPPPPPPPFDVWLVVFQQLWSGTQPMSEGTLYGTTGFREENWLDDDGYWRMDILELYYEDSLKRVPDITPSMQPTRAIRRYYARQRGYPPRPINWPTPTSGRFKPVSGSVQRVLDEIHKWVEELDRGR